MACIPQIRLNYVKNIYLFVYRGAEIPSLQGSYVFGDFSQTFFGNNGRLFHLMGDQVMEFPLIGQEDLSLSLLGFGQDAGGEMYVLANGTGIPFGDTGVVLRMNLAQCGDQNGDGDDASTTKHPNANEHDNT